MDWKYLLTSIDGRISRQPFWIATLILFGIEIAAHYAIGDRWGSIVSLLLAYPTFAVIAKRGHDRNAPTSIAVVFIAGAVVLDVMALLDLIGPPEKPNTLFYVFLAPFGIMAIILLIDFGFRRGTVGENRFGPDPLEGAR
jgi:uncharacterized membrane protein YhaH (DUF805 family)